MVFYGFKPSLKAAARPASFPSMLYSGDILFQSGQLLDPLCAGIVFAHTYTHTQTMAAYLGNTKSYYK